MDDRNISEDDLHLGIDVLDDEHRQLLAVTTRLVAACRDGSDSQSIDRLAAELVACVEDHIRSEEAQMAAWDYGGIDRHKAAHATLFGSLEAILQPVRHGARHDVADGLLGFLLTWLDGHILGEDKLFADFLKDRGVR